MTIFDKINYGIRNSETSLVNLLSALAPWAAPLAPAFMSYYHMTGSLGFPTYIAWAVAIVVEILGLSAISTILAFWSYNRRRVAEYRKAPVTLAVFSFAFYLGVILTVNVLLDAASIAGFPVTKEVVAVLAKALLTLLSVPAAVILAVRTQHKETLDQVEREKQERKSARAQPQPVLRSSAPVDGTISRRKRKFIADYKSGALQQQLETNEMPLNAASLSQLYGASERTVYRWMDEVKNGKQAVDAG